MPTTAFAPSISQVYEAFDAAAHRLFRVAMALSRRGVVRVDDLLAALHLANVPGAAAATRLLPLPPPPREPAALHAPWPTNLRRGRC